MKLSKLTYLSLRGSSAILALPDSIGEMEGLMYLDLSGCSGIKKIAIVIWQANKVGASGFLELFSGFICIGIPQEPH
jgi:hypothetical protein